MESGFLLDRVFPEYDLFLISFVILLFFFSG